MLTSKYVSFFLQGTDPVSHSSYQTKTSKDNSKKLAQLVTPLYWACSSSKRGSFSKLVSLARSAEQSGPLLSLNGAWAVKKHEYGQGKGQALRRYPKCKGYSFWSRGVPRWKLISQKIVAGQFLQWSSLKGISAPSLRARNTIRARKGSAYAEIFADPIKSVAIFDYNCR